MIFNKTWINIFSIGKFSKETIIIWVSTFWYTSQNTYTETLKKSYDMHENDMSFQKSNLENQIKPYIHIYLIMFLNDSKNSLL